LEPFLACASLSVVGGGHLGVRLRVRQAQAMEADTAQAGRGAMFANAQQLADALLPFAQESRSFVRYDEAPKAHESKLDVDAIMRHAALLEALRRLAPKLGFRRSTMTEAMGIVFDTMNTKWQLKASDKHDYVATLSARLMNMCRNVQQGQLKSPRAAWVLALPWVAQSGADAMASNSGAGGSASARGASASVGVAGSASARAGGASASAGAAGSASASAGGDLAATFGYDVLLRQAWRQKGTMAKKEFAVKWLVEGKPAESFPQAQFADGELWSCGDITVAELQEPASRKRGRPEAIVDKIHPITKHRILVKPRADRWPLVAMYEQQRQVLQVRCDVFPGAGLREQEANALKHVADLAEKYMAGTSLEDIKT